MGMTSKVKVSVVMNCLNGEKYLSQAIDSVYNQTFKDWEIIFWDNASTDKSAEIAKSYGEKIRYFCSEKTYTLGKARNLSTKKTRGEFIAFLDCDDIWLSKKLEKQVSLLEKKEDVDLVFSDAIYFSEKGNLCQIYQKFKPDRGYIFSHLLRKYFLCFTSILVRKSAIGDKDWFNERLKYHEDADFCLRQAYKFKFDYCDEPLVKYYVSFDSRTVKDFGLLAREREITLESLRDEFPSIGENYSEEIKIYQVKTNVQKAISEWINGDPSKARSILKSIRYKNYLIRALYLITFLPRSTFKRLFFLNHQVKNWLNWYKFE